MVWGIRNKISKKPLFVVPEMTDNLGLWGYTYSPKVFTEEGTDPAAEDFERDSREEAQDVLDSASSSDASES